MKMANLYSFKDSAEITEALGQYIKKAYDEAIAKNDRFTIAISGGSLGKFMGSGIVRDTSVDWKKWYARVQDDKLFADLRG